MQLYPILSTGFEHIFFTKAATCHVSYMLNLFPLISWAESESIDARTDEYGTMNVNQMYMYVQMYIKDNHQVIHSHFCH